MKSDWQLDKKLAEKLVRERYTLTIKTSEA